MESGAFSVQAWRISQVRIEGGEGGIQHAIEFKYLQSTSGKQKVNNLHNL